ncbi:MAG TPA: ABC transporter permease [Firmicutes bacterium]|nr:ABC transporter permease [Bacillota bacterium]
MDLSPELFQPIRQELQADAAIVRPSVTYWQDAWRRLKQNRGAMIGLTIVLFLFAAAIFGPYLSPYTYEQQDLSITDQPPTWAHPFGTDGLGRDQLVRVLYGARISLTIGLFASFICLTVGVVYGGVSALIGGKTDEIMMRIAEILYSIPLLLYVILFMVVLQPGLKNILLAIGLVYWINMARIVRGQILSLKEQDYVLAARTIGASKWRILMRHLIPNTMGPIIVAMTLEIPQAIFTEAFLSFIGLGVAAPMASWGTLASEGLQAIRDYPHELIFPALAICLTMLAFNLLGDGLRDALDPRMRR